MPIGPGKNKKGADADQFRNTGEICTYYHFFFWVFFSVIQTVLL